MNFSKPILDLTTFKLEDEKFIYGIAGALRLHFVEEALYSFMPYPFGYCFLPAAYTTYVKCVLAVTDKRFIIIGKTPRGGHLDESQVYSFDFRDVKIQYKKSFGSRMFIFDIGEQQLFNFLSKTVIFEINPKYYDDIENIRAVISEYNS